MAVFRIYHLRESRLEAFRQRTPEKTKRLLYAGHYSLGGQIEAESPYLAWKQLAPDTGRGGETGNLVDGEAIVETAPAVVADAEADLPQQERPRLSIGDVVQPDGGEPLLCNYWGFDPAEWKDGATPEQLAGEAPEETLDDAESTDPEQSVGVTSAGRG